MYKKLVKQRPNDFNYNYKLAATLAARIELMPRIKGAAYVPEMMSQLEKTYKIAFESSKKVISLPFHPWLEKKEIDKVVRAISETL